MSLKDYLSDLFREPKYRQQFAGMVNTASKTLIVDFEDLMKEPSIAQDLVDNPADWLKNAEEAAREQLVIEDSEYAEKIEKVNVRVRNLPEAMQLRKVGALYINKLICVEGIVVRASNMAPKVLKAVFKCPRCNTEITKEQTGISLEYPLKCGDESCNQTGGFRFLPDKTTYVDSQALRIQEKPEDLSPGRMPRPFECKIVGEELVDLARPGDHVRISGILHAVPSFGLTRRTSLTFDIYLEVNDIVVQNKETELAQLDDITIEKIKELSKDQWIFNKISNSIAPSIYGSPHIKEAIMYLLFGGVAKQHPDVKIRGEINVLLVGDPGIAKSLLLQATAKLAPRGLYTCYSEDTEILTENGWMLFNQLKDEKVLTLNPTTEQMEYYKPTRKIKEFYKGKMFHQEGLYLDLLVTPNHNLWARKARAASYGLISAEKLPRHYSIKRGGIWKGKYRKLFTLPSIQNKLWNGSAYYAQTVPETRIRLNDWLSFFGIYLAEGHCTNHDKTKKYNVIITQTTERNKEQIREWIRNCGFSFFEVETNGQFVISNKQLWSYLRKFGHAHDKFIPKEIKMLSGKHLKFLFGSMMLGDGYYGLKGKSYTTTSKRLADDFQEICIKIGFTAQIRRVKGSWRPGSEQTWYVICISERKDTIRMNHKSDNRSWADYEGYVYCVEVPTHLIYVRRNGKPLWCGNSGRGTTAAGLTAAVLKDKSGEMNLEAGALVLADKGIAAIDELDKMKTEDRSAMHEALEQHTVSIAKAGIVATLNARTAVLAAANPKWGRYDTSRTIGENVELPITLLSRFDLIFIMIDKPDKAQDTEMSKYILDSHGRTETLVTQVPLDLLRQYISYARQLKPRLTEEAKKIIQDYFLKLRDLGADRTGPIAITPRQLEGLIRIAEAHARIALRDKVTVEDAQAAVAIFNESMQQVCFDATTGKMDRDILDTGAAKSTHDKLKVAYTVVIELEKETGLAETEVVYKELEKKGISRDEAEALIGMLYRDNKIYEPRPGYLKKV